MVKSQGEMSIERQTPELLQVVVGYGMVGPGTQVDWDGERLVYQRNFEEDEALNPSLANWTVFWAKLDEIDAWSWSGVYEPPATGIQMTCRPQWSIEILYGDKGIIAQGSAYPPDGTLEETRPWRQFCWVLGRLCGGRQV